MKQHKLKTGKGELNSTGGNHLLGMLIERHAQQAIPVNFQPRRSDAIADRDILLTRLVCFVTGALIPMMSISIETMSSS